MGGIFYWQCACLHLLAHQDVFSEPTRAQFPLLAYYKASSMGLQQKGNFSWASLLEKEREDYLGVLS